MLYKEIKPFNATTSSFGPDRGFLKDKTPRYTQIRFYGAIPLPQKIY